MKNVLVTGGAGFIGSNFIRYLLNLNLDLQVVNFDALTYAGRLENLLDVDHDERYQFVHGDICDRQVVHDVLGKFEIDTIVHFAAETHVDRSILGPDKFVQTNVIGTFNLLEEARNFWLGKQKRFSKVHFHHISTDEVFGSLERDEAAFTESTPYAPNSPYSASKAASDHLVRAYFQTYDLPVTISNCSNNYGPQQFPEKLIPLIILNAINGKPLPVYGDGNQIRDWLYVEDHCDAIWKILNQGYSGQTYVVGGNNQPTNLEIVNMICSMVDDEFPDSPFRPHSQLIQFVADRPGHDRRYAMNIEKIHQELDWLPRESLVSGLKKTVQWYISHPEWVEAITKQNLYQSWMKNNYSQRGKS